MEQQSQELWIPDSLKRYLVVGARIRIRRSGECQYEWPRGNGVRGHIKWAEEITEGKTGTIIEIAGDSYGGASHNYHIRLNPPIIVGSNLLLGMWLAAVEMEPLDD